MGSYPVVSVSVSGSSVSSAVSDPDGSLVVSSVVDGSGEVVAGVVVVGSEELPVESSPVVSVALAEAVVFVWSFGVHAASVGSATVKKMCRMRTPGDGGGNARRGAKT